MTLSEKNRGANRNWVWQVCGLWVIIALSLVYWRWAGIQWFALGDTDDNMRMMQVRALLNGQDWYDLRQYRLSPPGGADIHWSRFVDLPLAALILIFRPILGGMMAEKIAVTVAPLLPMLLLMLSLVLASRRLIGRENWIFIIAMFAASQMLMPMFAPLRIDHHGWQLALVALLIAAIADPDKRRGGMTAGIATVLSLVIGLEMLPYLALAGGTFVLRWIAGAGDAVRLRSYGLALSIGTGLGYLIFASNANRVPRCDALTPVWLSAMVGAGILCVVLSLIRSADWKRRFLVAAILGVVLTLALGWFWPQCVGQLEQLSPDLKRYWFDHVREVKPVYEQSIELITIISFAAFVGLIGFLHALVQSRGSLRFVPWLSLFALFVASCGLVIWQTRAGPAVQLMTIMPLSLLAAIYIPKVRETDSVLRRILGTVIVFGLISGLAVQLATPYLARPAKESKKAKARNANALCATIPALAQIARLPRGTVFTFVDLSPRLITLTKHNAIAGPYHRNGEAIVDVHRAFRDTPERAEKAVRKYRSDYVLICPGSSESTLFKADAPKEFYMQLAADKAPAWLERVELPAKSPYMIWRVLPPKP